MAKYTKQKLAEALKSLLAERQLDKITVKEITDRCSLNRQTFYYNFQDVFSLLDWIFLQEVETMHLGDLSHPWQDSFTQAFSYLCKNKSMVLNIYNSVGRVRLEQHLRSALISVFEARIEQLSPGKLSAESKKFYTTFFASGLLGIIFAWLDNSMTSNLNISIEQLAELTDRSIRAVLQEN